MPKQIKTGSETGTPSRLSEHIPYFGLETRQSHSICILICITYMHHHSNTCRRLCYFIRDYPPVRPWMAVSSPGHCSGFNTDRVSIYHLIADRITSPSTVSAETLGFSNPTVANGYSGIFIISFSYRLGFALPLLGRRVEEVVAKRRLSLKGTLLYRVSD